MPPWSSTRSPGAGAGSTLKAPVSPEQPPGVTTRRNPDSALPPILSMRRMNFSAAAVTTTSMLAPLCGRLIARQALVDHTGVVHRADRGALRRIEMSDALGAFLRIDEEHAALLGDRNVGAFRLACRATGALRRDDFQWHGSLFLRSVELIDASHAAMNAP